MKIRFLFFSIFVLIGTSAFSQLTVSQAAPQYFPAQNLVQNVLVGTGVSVSNFAITGQTGIAFFNGVNSNIGIDSGIVMSSGGWQTVVPGGPNNTVGAGGVDADLVMLLQSLNSSSTNLNNLVRIEFDFVPVGDSVKFDYVFASREYPSFTCSSFNDAFGFFLSGPGISGPFSNGGINIALIPGTTIPVAINTLNSGSPANHPTCLAANPNYMTHAIYFVNNAAQATVNMPGFTVPLTAEAQVQCGQTYRIKMAIADVADGALNSAVFLEAGSFVGIEPDLQTFNPFPNSGDDSTLIEGCNYGFLQFTNANPVVDTSFIYYDIAGTATNGLDYDSLDGQVPFFPGNTEKGLIVNPLLDSLNEGIETVIITTLDSGCVVGGINKTFYIVDNHPIYVKDLPDTLFFCDYPYDFTIDASVDSGGIPPYNFEWTYRGILYPTNDSLFISKSWSETVDSITVFIFDNCFAGHTFTKTVYMVRPDTCEVPDIPPPPPPPLDTTLSIPNTFSPNADGSNDFYFVKNLNNRNSGSIKIYNRWGNVVFESADFRNCTEDNAMNCWNGTDKNGRPAAEGVYFYELVVDNKDKYTGSITLFR